MRFRKLARNSETAALRYHPAGSRGYVLASTQLDTPPSPPSSDSPPPEPPLNDHAKHVPDKYHPYADVFSPIDVEKLPPHRPGFDAAIEVEDGASPPFGPLYHLSKTERALVLDYVESNLRKGFIRRSSSSAGAPILFARKKTGELRLCVDYRGLNAITKKNRYPLPLINDLLDRVQGCTVFTTLDLKNAFNLIRIREGDEWKTAFRTHLGLFEYLVMPFGLTNAPGTFQAYIQDALRDLLDVICVVYIDDILIFSRTQAEHNQHVTMVLDRLRKAGLFANAKKCAFDQPEVEYVGYIINQDGIRMDPKKLNTVIDWPMPGSVKEVQSFLGFTNFYRRFIQNYARIALPLNRLTTKAAKGAPFEWTPEANAAFEALRDAVLSAPVLRHFDPSCPSTLSTDASDFAIAGVLHQPDDQGLLHPVAFFSRKLTPAEINYEVYDKELLAIVESFRTFRAWLIGTVVPVAVVSDHKNLEYFMSSRVLNRRQARWSMFLSEFNFRLDYAPGIKNPADAPSRRADFAPREGDAVLSENHKALLSPVHTERIFDPARRDTSSAASVHLAALTTISLDRADFQERLKAALRSDPEWREAVRRGDPDFVVKGSLVYHRNLLFIPRPLRSEILFSRHDSVSAGHPGRERTRELVARDFSWPGVSTYVRQYVESCDTCGRVKVPRHKPFGLLQPLEIPRRPWQDITMDHIVKLPPSHGFDSVWVVCDRLTRYAHFIPCTESSDAPEFAWLFLDRIFRHHGMPESIVSDRGPVFVSRFWNTLTSLLHTKLKYSTAYHPQTDGLTERTNQSLETYLRAYVSTQQDDWVDYLPLAEFAFNNHVNASTKQSPFYANLGYHPTFDPLITPPSVTVPAAGDLAQRLTRIHNECRAQLLASQDRQSRYYNERVKDAPAFKEGDLVWLLRRHIKTTRPSDKLDHRRLGPFPIETKLSDLVYRLRLPAYLSRLHPVFHVSLLEPYSAHPDLHPLPEPIPFDLSNELPPSEPQSVLDCRRTGRRFEYLVHWKGLPAEEDSWTPIIDLPSTPAVSELLERWHRRHPRAPRPPHSLLWHNPSIDSANPTIHTPVPQVAEEDASALAPSSFQVAEEDPPPSSSRPPAPAVAPSRLIIRLPPSRQPVAPRVRRTPSPVPSRENLRAEYTPPTQTTTRSGRVARPVAKYDP
ncbi:Transposon Tf2-12 polyprotein [Trametes pubescens]|uniref:Transposon Tf2-12 polyprotein n=1 Tax=Trametes pubescens TaxID=154538 RepID=A0A1M2VSS2_TRAPU|nr:Transposon Tf2-12 polyprotein [Trametes pubescens]